MGTMTMRITIVSDHGVAGPRVAISVIVGAGVGTGVGRGVGGGPYPDVVSDESGTQQVCAVVQNVEGHSFSPPFTYV